MARSRPVTTHGTVAKELRAEFRTHGPKAKVKDRSERFHSCVEITIIEDITPTLLEYVRRFVSQYEAGMREELPQVDVISLLYEPSDDILGRWFNWIEFLWPSLSGMKFSHDIDRAHDSLGGITLRSFLVGKLYDTTYTSKEFWKTWISQRMESNLR